MIQNLVLTRSWQYSRRISQKIKLLVSMLLDFGQNIVEQPGHLMILNKCLSSQSPWEAASCPPATRSESVSPILPVDGDGDGPMAETDIGNEATTSSLEECETTEICFGAVSHIAE
jgi:hypothetical protein